MSEGNLQVPTPPEPVGDPADVPAIVEIVKTAEIRLATITESADTAKAAATAAGAASDAAKAAAAESEESQRLVAVALTDVQAKLAEALAVATQAVAAKTQITDGQAVIATKSDHIQKAQEHADKVRADLDRVLTAATQQATAAEGQKSNAQSAAETAAALLADIRTAKGAVETDATSIATTRETAEASAALTKGLADKAAAVEARIAAYEQRLGELDSQCVAQLKTIEALLPGATSAGLAHAFDERRQTFLKPHDRWQWLFVGSVLTIVGLAVSGVWHVYHLDRVPTYDDLVRLWLARLPVAGALVWLALHASRESALAKRLEEDYGYKAAIASCFEGFRKQMAEIGMDVAPDSQVAKLCENTLTTIAAPPGRIYDKHKLIVSPTDELGNAVKAAGEAVNSVVPRG